MSVENLSKSRKRVFLIYPICMFLWSISRTDHFQTYFTSQFQTGSHSHLKSFLISQMPTLIGAILMGFGLYLFCRYIKSVHASNMSIQNVLKDEFAKFEWSIALHISYVIIVILLGVLTTFGALGLSGKDVSLILFGSVVGLPFLIFAIRDNLNE